MIATTEFALGLALDRFQRALCQPLRIGELEWAEHLVHVLSTLQPVFERHAENVESSAGLLSQAADPSLLPFTRTAALCAQLRQEHREFGRSLAGLQHQIQAQIDRTSALSATRVRAELLEKLHDRLFRALLHLARQGESLAAAIEHHLLVEQALAGTDLEGRAARPNHPRMDASRIVWAEGG
jgi:hypothetical protein